MPVESMSFKSEPTPWYRKVLRGLLWGTILGLSVSTVFTLYILNQSIEHAEVRDLYIAKGDDERAFFEALPHGSLFTHAHGGLVNRVRVCLKFIGYAPEHGSKTLTRVQTIFHGQNSDLLLTGSEKSVLTRGCSDTDMRTAGFQVERQSGRVAQNK